MGGKAGGSRGIKRGGKKKEWVVSLKEAPAGPIGCSNIRAPPPTRPWAL